MYRGSNADYAWHSTSAHAPAQMPMPAGDVAYDGRPEPPASAAASALHPYQHPLQTPLYSDILIAHSTVPGQCHDLTFYLIKKKPIAIQNCWIKINIDL